jgi:hypothetical protein
LDLPEEKPAAAGFSVFYLGELFLKPLGGNGRDGSSGQK